MFEMNCWPRKSEEAGAHVCWWALAGVVVLLSTALEVGAVAQSIYLLCADECTFLKVVDSGSPVWNQKN